MDVFAKQTAVAAAPFAPPCPANKPKAPLSAYNLFFQLERRRILHGTCDLGLPVTHQDLAIVAAEHKAKTSRRVHRKAHGKIGFCELAHAVACRWKALDKKTKMILEDYAKVEKENYLVAFEFYKQTDAYRAEVANQLIKQRNQGPMEIRGAAVKVQKKDEEVLETNTSDNEPVMPEDPDLDWGQLLSREIARLQRILSEMSSAPLAIQTEHKTGGNCYSRWDSSLPSPSSFEGFQNDYSRPPQETVALGSITPNIMYQHYQQQEHHVVAPAGVEPVPSFMDPLEEHPLEEQENLSVMLRYLLRLHSDMFSPGAPELAAVHLMSPVPEEVFNDVNFFF